MWKLCSYIYEGKVLVEWWAVKEKEVKWEWWNEVDQLVLQGVDGIVGESLDALS